MISSQRSFLTGLLGFIVAGIVSNLATLLVFASGLLTLLLSLVPAGQPLVRLIIGVILAFLGVGLGGAAGGLVRGYVLHRIDAQGSRTRYLTSAAFANGLAHGILVIPALLFISLVSMYNPGSEKTPTTFMVLFGLLGALFGLTNGFVLAVLTARLRYAWLLWLANVGGSLLGGALFGLLLWRPAWLASGEARILAGALFLVVAGIVMNATTGGMLGLAYGWLARQRQTQGVAAVTPRRWQDVATILVGSALFLAVMASTNQIVEFITIYPGSIRTSLTAVTEAVHWQATNILAGIEPVEDGVGLTAGPGVVWSQAGDVFYSAGGLAGATAVWPTPINISQTPQTPSRQPQATSGSDGATHIVWAEEERILYSRCADGSCTAPAALATACGPGAAHWPVIAMNDAETVMVAWSTDESAIAYATWTAGQSPENGRTGCLSYPDLSHPQAQLAPTADGFRLVVAAPPGAVPGPVTSATFGADGWGAPQVVGQGQAATMATAVDGRWQMAWCSAAGHLVVLAEGDSAESVVAADCTTRPALVDDAAGRLHLLYAADSLDNNFGRPQPVTALVETIRQGEGWTEPSLVAQTATAVAPLAARSSDGTLHLLWQEPHEGTAATIFYTTQPTYDCADLTLPPSAQAMLAAIESGVFHPADYQSPYCGNRYDGLVFMPAPETAVATLPPDQHTGFDQTADFLTGARYEVLFSNMQWDPDTDELSPGFRLAEGVAKLYQQVKTNPDAYPRGMTVRILLGNYPNIASLQYGDQIWGLVHDLAEAGVDTMADPEIGWKVEVANYAGSFPHSHTKFAVIDGQTLLTAGYNISWFHLPKDDPSGRGEGLTDLGIILTGPVAQTGLMVFDDMWAGANQLICAEMAVDRLTEHCEWTKGVVSHTPEVLRFYPTSSEDAAFAIYRTGNYKEADEAYLGAIRTASTSIDAMHVNFSAELICLVNLVSPGVCDYESAVAYMKALVDAVEANGVQVRVIVENANMNGMENRVGLEILQEELARRGLEGQVEVRFFNGRLHTKSALIDGQMLIVGSQNFHYSSFGEGGLLEFNAATTAPEAIDTYQAMFDYYWEQAVPAAEAQWGEPVTE